MKNTMKELTNLRDQRVERRANELHYGDLQDKIEETLNKLIEQFNEIETNIETLDYNDFIEFETELMNRLDTLQDKVNKEYQKSLKEFSEERVEKLQDQMMLIEKFLEKRLYHKIK